MSNKVNRTGDVAPAVADEGQVARAAAFRAEVMQVVRQSELDRMVEHPAFASTSLAMVESWAPQADDDLSMTRTLRDVGHYMAGVWALYLAASPQGLTHASLSELLELTGIGSRNRAHAMLVYLQFIRLIEHDPDPGGDGRVRRFRPRAALRQLFVNRFRRQMTTLAPLAPEVAATLAHWDDPGVFEAFMVANGRFMIGSYLSYDQSGPTLDVFSHRNSGLTILGQILTQANEDGRFPPPGPVQLNLSDLARRSGASRGQVKSVLKAGVEAGFLVDLPDGRTGFSDALIHQVKYLLAAYGLSLAWCAREAAGKAAVEPQERRRRG